LNNVDLPPVPLNGPVELVQLAMLEHVGEHLQDTTRAVVEGILGQ
jgi:hypothetical protein